MAGAHRTLQLPAIVDVTDLQTGRQIRIRLDDRGPSRPRPHPRPDPARGRPPRDAGDRQPPRSASSWTIWPARRSATNSAAAPASPVRPRSQLSPEESLAPPGQPARARVPVAAPTASIAATADRTLDRLPETVRTVPVQPGQLWIRVAEFTQNRYAEVLRNKLYGVPAHIQREGEGAPTELRRHGRPLRLGRRRRRGPGPGCVCRE